jgi:hypothetical protein
MFQFNKLRTFLSISLALAATIISISIILSRNANAAAERSALETGFRQMYNLNFSGAHKTFEAWEHLHPKDPLGAASNAAVYLFAEFERLHILDLELFTDSQRLDDLRDWTPDADVKFAFQTELAQADDLAGKALSESSNDENALFAKALADGLRGNYEALIEKRKARALDFLKSSRTTAERLVRIDPDYHDAYLAIGIENYLLGLRAAPTRWVLRLTGAQTDKNKGIDNLKITAKSGPYLGPYARLLLAIAAMRDHDRSTAKDLLGGLAKEFPDNRLYKAELARLQN